MLLVLCVEMWANEPLCCFTFHISFLLPVTRFRLFGLWQEVFQWPELCVCLYMYQTKTLALAGSLGVSALILGHGRRSEHRMSLWRHTPLLKPNDDSQRTPSPSSVPQLHEISCHLPDYKEPEPSADAVNGSCWQPGVVAAPQAANTAAVCTCSYSSALQKSAAVAMFQWKVVILSTL